MNVVDDLRMPDVVNLVYGELRLDLRERVPVAVVIVTRVFVINVRRLCSLGGSDERLAGPLLDNIDSGGVERRNGEDARVVGYRRDSGFVRRGEPVRDQHAREIRT